MKKQTQLIINRAEKTHNRENTTPLYLTSSFCYEDAEQGKELFAGNISGNVYSRFSNPNYQEFVEKICILEELEDGVATATGMSAVFSCFGAHLASGDHLVSSKALFGSTKQIITKILSKWGITCTFVEATAPKEVWESAIQPNTRMIFLETPSNPGLEIVDLEMIGQLTKKYGLIYCIDNCFATPILQVPSRFGANLVLHSATKFMDGQGRVLGGVIVGTKELMEEVRFFTRQTGPAMSPFNAWTLSKSLETLPLRMERHCSNALKLAQTLENVDGILKVNYPFLDSFKQKDLAKRQMSAGGGMITFDLDGGFERVVRFSKLLKIPALTSNLGDSRTIVTNPFTTTHSKLSTEEKYSLGIYEGSMRVSVGLEDIDDLIEDFTQAIAGSK